MKHRIFALTALLTTTLALPAVAHAADQSGDRGRATSIDVNSTSSDSYAQFHGRVFVTAGKRTTEYRWGGTSCGSKILSDAQVALLVDAVRNRDEIKPRYQAGQGQNTKCLVGFQIHGKN